MSSPTFFSLVIVYAGLNVWVFALFALDNLAARFHSWRVVESSLLVLAGIGPFGALAAVTVFRHKTRRVKFYLVPFLAFLHAVLILWLYPGIS